MSILASGFLLLTSGFSFPQEAAFPGGKAFVQVTVTDPLRRYVAGLDISNFRLYEGKKHAPRDITGFTHQSAPVTLAIIYDLRLGDQSTYRQQVTNCVRRFLGSGNSEDEAVLIPFHRTGALAQMVSGQGVITENIPSFNEISGLSELEQAVDAGLTRIKNKTGKKALAIVTAADDREVAKAHSRAGAGIGAQPGLQLFTIKKAGVLPRASRSSKPSIIGTVYILEDFQDAGYYLDLVCDEVRNQYILEYSPSGGESSGALRDVSVEIDSPKGLPKLKAKVGKPYLSDK